MPGPFRSDRSNNTLPFGLGALAGFFPGAIFGIALTVGLSEGRESSHNEWKPRTPLTPLKAEWKPDYLMRAFRLEGDTHEKMLKDLGDTLVILKSWGNTHTRMPSTSGDTNLDRFTSLIEVPELRAKLVDSLSNLKTTLLKANAESLAKSVGKAPETQFKLALIVAKIESVSGWVVALGVTHDSKPEFPITLDQKASNELQTLKAELAELRQVLDVGIK